ARDVGAGDVAEAALAGAGENQAFDGVRVERIGGEDLFERLARGGRIVEERGAPDGDRRLARRVAGRGALAGESVGERGLVPARLGPAHQRGVGGGRGGLDGQHGSPGLLGGRGIAPGAGDFVGGAGGALARGGDVGGGVVGGGGQEAGQDAGLPGGSERAGGGLDEDRVRRRPLGGGAKLGGRLVGAPRALEDTGGA